jgi:hypothetical protein
MHKIIGLVAVAATIGLPVAIGAQPAWAQTNGMERRDDRRDTRQVSRDVKQACKSTGETRAECRQTKRDVKQTGRRTPGGPNDVKTTTPR